VIDHPRKRKPEGERCDPIFGKQAHRRRTLLAVFGAFEGLAPSFLLSVDDLLKIRSGELVRKRTTLASLPNVLQTHLTLKATTMTLALAGLLVVPLAFSASAPTYDVDVNSTNAAAPYTNRVSAATNVEPAVDAELAGDEILGTNLRLQSTYPAGKNVSVTWQSVAGANYFLERSTNLTTTLFITFATDLVGQAVTTSCKETNAASLPRAFYLVGIAD